MGAARDLEREPRLPDAGCAFDEDHATGTRGDGTEAVEDDRLLPATAHERKRARRPRRQRADKSCTLRDQGRVLFPHACVELEHVCARLDTELVGETTTQIVVDG